jgi:hypothetical protein
MPNTKTPKMSTGPSISAPGHLKNLLRTSFFSRTAITNKMAAAVNAIPNKNVVMPPSEV